MVGPVRVTAPARTVIDLAGGLEPRYVEPLIADVLGRRLLTRRELERAMDRAPHRPGVALVRSLIEAPKLTRSEAERLLLELIREAGLPEPDCNAKVGPYVVDVLWPEHRLIVEFDSREWHGDHVHGRFESDRRRDGHTLALGFATKRVTWRELTTERRELTGLLKDLLERRALPME
jgi:very-short-patch-repair endonuclease